MAALALLILFELRPLLTHFAAPSDPTRTVWCALSIVPMLVGCLSGTEGSYDPMLCPIHVSGLGLCSPGPHLGSHLSAGCRFARSEASARSTTGSSPRSVRQLRHHFDSSLFRIRRWCGVVWCVVLWVAGGGSVCGGNVVGCGGRSGNFDIIVDHLPCCDGVL